MQVGWLGGEKGRAKRRRRWRWGENEHGSSALSSPPPPPTLPLVVLPYQYHAMLVHTVRTHGLVWMDVLSPALLCNQKGGREERRGCLSNYPSIHPTVLYCTVGSIPCRRSLQDVMNWSSSHIIHRRRKKEKSRILFGTKKKHYLEPNTPVNQVLLFFLMDFRHFYHTKQCRSSNGISSKGVVQYTKSSPDSCFSFSDTAMGSCCARPSLHLVKFLLFSLFFFCFFLVLYNVLATYRFISNTEYLIHFAVLVVVVVSFFLSVVGIMVQW